MEEITMVTTPPISTPSLVLIGTIMACTLFLFKSYMKERSPPLLEIVAGSEDNGQNGPREPTI